jgi:hypothetical protein
MTDASAPDPSIDTQALAGLRGVMERQLAVLGRLAEAGLSLAIDIERQATAQGPAKLAPGEAALAYARVSRAVRLTLALQSKVIQQIQSQDEVASRYRAGDRQEARARDTARKGRIQRLVERVIGEEIADDDRAERLADEAGERLEHDDIYGDLRRYSPGEIVARVCRDLGLAPDWSRWAQEAWTQEAAPADPEPADRSPALAIRRGGDPSPSPRPVPAKTGPPRLESRPSPG